MDWGDIHMSKAFLLMIFETAKYQKFAAQVAIKLCLTRVSDCHAAIVFVEKDLVLEIKAIGRFATIINVILVAYAL